LHSSLLGVMCVARVLRRGGRHDQERGRRSHEVMVEHVQGSSPAYKKPQCSSSEVLPVRPVEKGLVCNRKVPICKDPTVEINSIRLVF
jgi:hypothetical protein